MKAIISILTNSIAIIFDAINTLSDTLLSTITIVSTRLAHLPPDKKHPLGYGRIECLTASAVSMIVLYAGITSLIDSIQNDYCVGSTQLYYSEFDSDRGDDFRKDLFGSFCQSGQ